MDGRAQEQQSATLECGRSGHAMCCIVEDKTPEHLKRVTLGDIGYGINGFLIFRPGLGRVIDTFVENEGGGKEGTIIDPPVATLDDLTTTLYLYEKTGIPLSDYISPKEPDAPDLTPQLLNQLALRRYLDQHQKTNNRQLAMPIGQTLGQGDQPAFSFFGL